MSERALFSCGNPHCAAEVSWPAKDLRMWEDRPICDVCYDAEATDNDLIWSDLPRFVPPYEWEIARLTEERDRLREQVEQVLLINERLLAERDRLREALAPFAEAADRTPLGPSHNLIRGPCGLRFLDLQNARAALAKEPTDAE